jgi:hypothetical protein
MRRLCIGQYGTGGDGGATADGLSLLHEVCISAWFCGLPFPSRCLPRPLCSVVCRLLALHRQVCGEAPVCSTEVRASTLAHAVATLKFIQQKRTGIGVPLCLAGSATRPQWCLRSGVPLCGCCFVVLRASLCCIASLTDASGLL